MERVKPISPSDHLKWQKNHRQFNNRKAGFHRLNQGGNFKEVLKGEMKHGDT